MTRYLVPALVAALVAVGTSRADITTDSFSIAGLAGTGVTADVMFSYENLGLASGILTITITNTSTDVYGENGFLIDPRISGFGFNVPDVVTSIDVFDDMVTAPTKLLDNVVDEADWWGLFESGGIKSPNGAGDFDFGVLNSGQNPNKFITDGSGLVPSIAPDETTIFTFDIDATGGGMGDFTVATFLGELSTGGTAGAFAFGARFQGIGNLGDSDFAVVPVPGAALLGLIGIGLVGSLRRKLA